MNIELSATEYRAFVKAGKLLAELGQQNPFASLETFPLVSQKAIDGMKKAIKALKTLEPTMTNDQYQVFTDVGNDLAHLKALKS